MLKVIKKNLILSLIISIPVSLICFTISSESSFFSRSKDVNYWESSSTDTTVSEKTLKKCQYVLEKAIGIILKEHYSPKKIDDSFSIYIVKQMFKAIDPDKNIFLKGQVDYLSNKYIPAISNNILQQDLSFLLELDSMFKRNVKSILRYHPKLLDDNFDFTKQDGYYHLDSDSLDYVSTDSERKERWRRQFKYLVLINYVPLVERREKSKDDSGFVYKSNEKLQKEAKAKVKKSIDKLLVRLDKKISFEDEFNILLGLIANYMDPHSEYQPKTEKRYFDEQMAKRFFGIGALLSQDENGIKIIRLTTGGPAWKSKKIVPGDYITAVGQGKKDQMEDIFGLNISEVVQLVRGKENTMVRLEIKKSEGKKMIVSLDREEIKQEDAVIKTSIIEKGSNKTGYIYIPDFYSSFGSKKGANCSVDFKKALSQLQLKGVNGIIIDLRSNGGGSLYEVVQMVGMLIPRGPIVQILTKEGYGHKFDDKFPDVIYDGPIVVMVNEFSASASEIFSAAIQDYNRGIVVGSESTFGKGTVQKPINLFSNAEDWSDNEKKFLGAIKVTIQKFYRVNGGSTQNKGVISDILLPTRYKYVKYLEKNNPYSLPWDQTEKLKYKFWRNAIPKGRLSRMSKTRLIKNTAFRAIDSMTNWVNENSLSKRSLNYDGFVKEKKDYEMKIKQFDSLTSLVSDTSYSAYLVDESTTNLQDVGVIQRNKEWVKNIPKDIYIQEAFNILDDFTHMKEFAVRNKPEEY